MEHAITAPSDGVVETIGFGPGALVEEGVELLKLKGTIMIRKLKSGEYRLYSRKIDHRRPGSAATSARSRRARRRKSTSARCSTSSGTDSAPN